MILAREREHCIQNGAQAWTQAVKELEDLYVFNIADGKFFGVPGSTSDAEIDAEIAIERRERKAWHLLDELRAAGWAVAVHNDYWQGIGVGRQRFTFWLFTNGDRSVKGEGPIDAEALQQIRSDLVARGELK